MVDEAIRFLEMQVGRRPNEKKRVVPVEEGGSLLDLSTPGTPGGSGMGMGMSRSLSTPRRSLGSWTFRVRLCICCRIWRCRLMVGRSRCHHRYSLRTRPSSVSSLLRRLLPVSAVVRKKPSHRHTPPANPQVPPQTPKTPPALALAQTLAQAQKTPLSASSTSRTARYVTVRG